MPPGWKCSLKETCSGRQTLLAVDGGPARSGVAAAQKFLVDAFVAGAAVAGGQMSADHEAVVIDLLLVGSRLVAVQAIDALLCVGGHLVLMHHRVLKARVTFRALARCANKVGGGLRDFDPGTRAIDKKCGQNERKCDDDSDETRNETTCE